MKYAFPQYFTDKSRFLSYTIVAKALTRAGHTLSENAEDCDAVLFSMCDVTEYPKLVKLKKSTNKPVILGGAYAFNYWSAILYSDAVWIGEIYDFAEMNSLQEIMNSSSCYTPGKDSLFSNQRIEWGSVPVCQIAPKKCYYWGGVGCKNKCRFCFTSWTHQHQNNDQSRIIAAKRTAEKNKKHIMIASNEYDAGEIGGKTRDMLLKDYIKEPVKGASFIRCGIEFATEDTRRKAGKPITRDQIYAAIQKMNSDNVSLRLFHIAGYDSIDDWEAYISDLCRMISNHENNRLIHLMFNNLQYQNYTPLYDERFDIDPSKYIDIRTTKRWYDELRQHSKHVLIGAPSPFQHVACRMGIELSRTKEQVDFWLSKLNNSKKKMTSDEAHRFLFESGVLDTPRVSLDFKTGEIKQVKGGDINGQKNNRLK